MTDNGGEFRSHPFRDTVRQLGAEHRFIRSGGPQTNGCGLRVLLIHGDELWGVETDELDVDYIVRYQLDRGS